jgi:hypothetical protein
MLVRIVPSNSVTQNLIKPVATSAAPVCTL